METGETIGRVAEVSARGSQMAHSSDLSIIFRQTRIHTLVDETKSIQPQLIIASTTTTQENVLLLLVYTVLKHMLRKNVNINDSWASLISHNVMLDLAISYSIHNTTKLL